MPYSCITTKEMQSVRVQSLSERSAYNRTPASKSAGLGGTMVQAESALSSSTNFTNRGRKFGADFGKHPGRCDQRVGEFLSKGGGFRMRGIPAM